jgi:7-keto-8-aminopelargonate synthetase-like enzyme
MGELQDSCVGSLEKYGVGSCGPRGFYGTIGLYTLFLPPLICVANMEEKLIFSLWNTCRCPP